MSGHSSSGDTPEGISLLFAAGSRLSAVDLARLLDTAEAGVSARISHRPDSAEGWLEILIAGLTFELRGLSPAEPAPWEGTAHIYGFDSAPPDGALEAVELVPASHIASGARLFPVMRAMLKFAADLALQFPMAAVVWQPAGTMMEPRYFSRVVLNWLAGGAFPSLGLTALIPARDGSVSSDGLSHFIGQEMQLEGGENEPPAEAVKLAVRLVDHLVSQGPIAAPQVIEQENAAVLAEPSAAGRRVWISRLRR